MILIINICKEEMHYYEFVKPVEDIISSSKKEFVTLHYKKNHSQIIKKLSTYERIIIAGTSLKDMDYSSDISLFKFLKSYTKPLLAICGGMQLLCMLYDCKLVKGREIGLQNITFDTNYLGVTGSREVYALHNMAIKDDSNLSKSFNVCSKTNHVQAVVHKKFLHYGVLFHPEVRNRDLIVNFLYVL